MTSKRPLTASALTAHIGYWMRLVSNNVSHAFARKLESEHVTVAEWVILRKMYGSAGTTSPSVVAELTGLSRGAVSKLIARLLEKKLVSRRFSAEDRRYQDVELTAKGDALVPRLAAHADRNDAEFFSCLTRAERSELERVLRKLAERHELKTQPIE